MDVWVLNGPNLSRLGTREPHVYGVGTYADLVATCERAGADAGVRVQVRQTDAEHVLIGWLHEAADAEAAVVLNAGAWTHTSVAVRDAAAQLIAPWVEVHLSNVHAREEFRRHSYLSDLADAVIVGLGVEGYAAGIRYLAGRPVLAARDRGAGVLSEHEEPSEAPRSGSGRDGSPLTDHPAVRAADHPSVRSAGPAADRGAEPAAG